MKSTPCNAMRAECAQIAYFLCLYKKLLKTPPCFLYIYFLQIKPLYLVDIKLKNGKYNRLEFQFAIEAYKDRYLQFDIY